MGVVLEDIFFTTRSLYIGGIWFTIVENTTSDIRPYMFILGLNETEGTILLHSSTESPLELIAIALALHLQIIWSNDTPSRIKVVLGICVWNTDPGLFDW